MVLDCIVLEKFSLFDPNPQKESEIFQDMKGLIFKQEVKEEFKFKPKNESEDYKLQGGLKVIQSLKNNDPRFKLEEVIRQKNIS